MSLSKEHVGVITKRIQHLDRRIAENKSKGKDLTYDRHERAALKSVLHYYSHELTKLETFAAYITAGAIASGEKVEDAVGVGIEAARVLIRELEQFSEDKSQVE